MSREFLQPNRLYARDASSFQTALFGSGRRHACRVGYVVVIPHSFLVGSPRRGKETAMRVAIEIENIDELGRCNGIGDIESHEDIGRLRVGDHVLSTFLSDTKLRTTLPVRITHIRAGRFRGRLAGTIARPEWLGLRPNVLVAFTAGQIHSIARPQTECARGKNQRGC